MDGLSDLARSDRDRRERRDEATAVERAFYDWQHVRVRRDLLVQRPVHEQVVDPPRRGALEAVARGTDVERVLEALEIAAQRVDQGGLDRIRDDGPSVGRDLGDVLADGGRVHGR